VEDADKLQTLLKELFIEALDSGKLAQTIEASLDEVQATEKEVTSKDLSLCAMGEVPLPVKADNSKGELLESAVHAPPMKACPIDVASAASDVQTAAVTNEFLALDGIFEAPARVPTTDFAWPDASSTAPPSLVEEPSPVLVRSAAHSNLKDLSSQLLCSDACSHLGEVLATPPPPLEVAIVCAQGLRNPYCVCEVDGKPAVKMNTKTVANHLSPAWNHEGQLVGYTPGDSLTFSVYDSDVGKRDDFLGRLTMPSSEFHPHGFDGEKPLHEAGRGMKAAFLKIRIAPVDDASRALASATPSAATVSPGKGRLLPQQAARNRAMP